MSNSVATAPTEPAPKAKRVRRGPINDNEIAKIWGLRLILVLGLLGVWQLVSLNVGGVEAGLPGPVDEFKAIGPTFSESSSWDAVGRTLKAWLIGFSVAAAIGLVVGAILGASRVVDHASRPTIDFVRTVPPIAILPLGALVLGVNLELEVIFIVIGAVWPILIQTMYGVGAAEQGHVDMAKLLRMNHRRRMRFVLIPGAIPYIATGFRLSAVMAFLLAISVELLAGVQGVGSEIHHAQFAGQYTEMYLFVVVATLIGASIGTLFVAVEKRVKEWSSPAASRS